MLTFLLRKLLLSLGYPQLEVPQHLVGPYRDIGVLQIRIPDSTACQIFYPSQKGNKKQKHQPYFRPDAVQGLIDYLKFGDGLLQILSEQSHPCHWQAEPLVSSTDPTEKFPLVLFSHGLAGTFEMYTELCQHMASLGYCVVALEHEDGSAAYAYDGKEVIPYKRPNDEPYSRQKVLKLRTPMLQQRVEELEAVVRYFEEKKRDNDDDDDDNNTIQLLKQVLDATNVKELHLVGHSFGGATQMLAAQQWTGRSNNVSILKPASLMVMDSWAFAMEEEVVQQGLSKNDRMSLNILSVISEDWEQNNSERLEIAKFLDNSNSNDNNRIQSMVASSAVHQSFSDSEAWFPSFMAQRVRNRGKGEDRHVTIRAVVEEWGQMTGKLDGTDTETKKRSSRNNVFLRPWIVSCMLLVTVMCGSIPSATAFQSSSIGKHFLATGPPVPLVPTAILTALYAKRQTINDSRPPTVSVKFSGNSNDGLVSSDNPLDQLLAWLSSDIVSIVLGSVGLLAVVVNRLALLDSSSATADALTSETRADLLAVFACGSVLLNGVTKLDVTSALAESVVLEGTTLSTPEILKGGDEESKSSLTWALSSILSATPAKSAVMLRRSSSIDWEVQSRAGVVPSSTTALQVPKKSPILDRVGLPGNIKETYLPTLQALPGRFEFTYLPSNTQLALLIPVSSGKVLVLGSNTAKSFSPRDVAWSRVIAKRISEYL